MRARLRSPAGKAAYARRKAVVEPVFGVLKQQRGIRQFRTRGLNSVNNEFNLATMAYNITRLRKVLFQQFFFRLARNRPQQTKERLLGLIREQLGPDYDMETHFTPRYNPWEQRLCLVPDGDLFKSIRDKRASVVTNEIDAFTKSGIKLRDGSEIDTRRSASCGARHFTSGSICE